MEFQITLFNAVIEVIIPLNLWWLALVQNSTNVSSLGLYGVVSSHSTCLVACDVATNV